MDEQRIQTCLPEDNKNRENKNIVALHPRDERQIICFMKRKKGEDLQSLKIAWFHQYENSKTTLKKAKEN